MTSHRLLSVAETADLIASGRVLLIAGEEELQRQLPPGSWIGGTTANFMTGEGGQTRRDILFVSDITPLAGKAEVRAYSIDALPKLPANYPQNGFTVLIVPGLSEIHAAFAKGAVNYEGVFDAPLYGWISGVAVSEIGVRAPKAFAGSSEALENCAVAMHVAVPEGKLAKIDIINLFEPGDGAVIEFDAEGFETTGDCLIGGARSNLAEYIDRNGLDTQLPLVADYNGAMINVSVRELDAATGKVTFYAPVFPGVKYRFARPVGEYIEEFAAKLKSVDLDKVALSCNCILNYLYAQLEGKRTGDVVGPITFGEIAYMLLNQTLVYATVEDQPKAA